MNCHACGGETVTLAVPEDIREYAAGAVAADTVANGADDETSLSTVAVCTNCLRVYAADSAGSSADPGVVSDALPPDPEAALALLLAAALLDSLAGNRPAIEKLLARVERAGVDPVLTFERLASDPDLDPAVDLVRRYRQFEQLRG